MEDDEDKVVPMNALQRLALAGRLAFKVARGSTQRGDPVFPRGMFGSLWSGPSFIGSIAQALSFGSFSGTNINYASEAGELTSSSLCMAVWQYMSTALTEAPPIVTAFKKGDTKGEIITDHALVELIKQPNPFCDGSTLLQAFALDWLFSGDVHWIIIFDKQYLTPVQLWYVPYFMMQPVADERDPSVFIKEYQYIVDGKRFAYDPQEVVHIQRGVNPRDLRRGIGVFDSVLREIYTDNQAANFSAVILKNWGIVPFVLSPPKGKGDSAIKAFGDNPQKAREQANRIKATFLEATTGDRRGEPIVNTIPLEITKLGFSPAELDISALRKVPESRIAAVTGLPASLLQFLVGLEYGTSYASYKEAREQAYESVIAPLLKIIAGAVNKQLLPKFGDPEGRRLEFSFDLSGVRVLQEDQDKVYIRADTGVKSGWLLVSDARSMVGLNSEDSDKVYLRSSATVAVKEGEDQPPPAPQLPPAAAHPALNPAPGVADQPANGGKPAVNGQQDTTNKILQAMMVKWLLDEKNGGNHNGNGHSNGHKSALEHFFEFEVVPQLFAINPAVARVLTEKRFTTEQFLDLKGGVGSGNFHHVGRPGLVGGSIAALGRWSNIGGIAHHLATRLVANYLDQAPLPGEGDVIWTSLDQRLVDYKPDRTLSDPSKTSSIQTLIPNARFEAYSQMPFLDELHRAIGITDPAQVDINEYVQKRDNFFRTLPVVDVPLDNLVVTQKTVNTARVQELAAHPEDPRWAGKPAFFVRYGNETYVINGHHRIVGDVMAGKTHMRGYLWSPPHSMAGFLKEYTDMAVSKAVATTYAPKGAVGSGNFQHEGRPGLVGGSAHSLAGTLKDYMVMVAKARGDAKDGWKYNGVEQLVLQEGEPFKAGPLPAGMEDGQLGLCYMNAYHAVEYGDDNLDYVEGFAVMGGIGVPLAHAWAATKDGHVVDPTWDVYRRKGEHIAYYGVRIPINLVRKTILARERYGVLHDTEQGFPLLRTGVKHAEVKGGAGSGNFQHEGRPGLVGGSAPAHGGSGHPTHPTDSQHKYKVDGKYIPSQAALHRKWIEEDLKNGVNKGEHIIWLLGGGPASGKTTAILNNLRAQGLIDNGDVTVDPDSYKNRHPDFERLGRAGDPFAGSYVHEETSDVSKQALAEAQARGFNVIYDTSGDNSIDNLQGKIEKMRANGAKVINAEYAFVSNIDQAVQQSKDRAEHQRRTQGYGRDVPEDFLRNTHASIAKVFPEAIKRGLFDTAKLWNTDILGHPRLVATYDRQNGFKILDQTMWNSFQNLATTP